MRAAIDIVMAAGLAIAAATQQQQPDGMDAAGIVRTEPDRGGGGGARGTGRRAAGGGVGLTGRAMAGPVIVPRSPGRAAAA